VGFGGRVLEDAAGGPKYLNSPETPVYTKGRQLYGLYQGRTALRERKQAFIVEGYMDVIGCHQAGFGCAVAPLGTATTVDQGRLLRRYVDEVIFLFDPDNAGRLASWRGSDVLLKADLFVRVAQLPNGQDPDEYILAEGAAALQQRLDNAQDVVDFWLDNVAGPRGHQDPLHDRVRKSTELLQWMGALPNEVLKDAWLKKISLRLGVDEEALKREFKKISGEQRPAHNSAQQPWRAANAPAAAAPKKVETRMPSVEEEMVQFLAGHPELAARVSCPPDYFADARCRRIFEAWKKTALERPSGWTVSTLLESVGPEDAAWLTSLMVEEKSYDATQETLVKFQSRLEHMALTRERQTLEPEIQKMLAGLSAKDESKILQYQKLVRTLKGGDRNAAAVPSDSRAVPTT
jgi:DNA primase